MLQIIFNGIITGLLIALFALGFQFVYLTTRIFHIASAGVFTIVPYAALATMNMSNSWTLSVLASLATGVFVSALCELCNHRFLERKNAFEAVHMVSSLGMLIVMVQSVAMVWGSNIQISHHSVDTLWKFSAVTLTSSQLLALAVSVSSILVVGLFLKFSSVGLRLRALADNPIEFSLLGFNVYSYRLAAFCISGVLIGVAALLTANEVGFEPYGGLHVFLLAVVAVILGGKSSFTGPIAGGVILGIIRSSVTYGLSARWQDVFTFLLLAIFLYIQPQGLFSAKLRLEMKE